MASKIKVATIKLEDLGEEFDLVVYALPGAIDHMFVLASPFDKDEAVLELKSGDIVTGKLKPSVHFLACEWLGQHRNRLKSARLNASSNKKPETFLVNSAA